MVLKLFSHLSSYFLSLLFSAAAHINLFKTNIQLYFFAYILAINWFETVEFC